MTETRQPPRSPRKPGARSRGKAASAQAAPKATIAALAKRICSPEFARELRDLLESEIRLLARSKVKDVVDPRAVRRLIAERNVRFLSTEVLVDVILHVQRTTSAVLRSKNESVLGLVDDGLAASIDAALEEDPEGTTHLEQFVADLMREEFVRALFTDIVYTSIVSFNERVNPLFGRLAVGMLEEQIRAFIRLFMPRILQEATAFATESQNQSVLFEFGRAIARRLLREPLPRYFDMTSAAQRRKMEVVVEQALGDAKLEALAREAALAAWDALYPRIRSKPVGKLLRLDANAGWLAERGAEVILPWLRRPPVRRFFAATLGSARP